ncbi:MAG: neutral zinc metallopeptidase [Ilumatobacter sp.]
MLASRRHVRSGVLLGTAALLIGCGVTDVETLVVSNESDLIVENIDPPFSEADPELVPEPTTDPGAAPVDDSAGDTPLVPDDAMGTETPETPEIDPADIDPNAIDFGPAKPEREYDDFLLASLADIERWLQSEFEPAFGFPYEPLQGGVYAGYPGRNDIPGCGGGPFTDYDLLQRAVAFYCPLGDFVAYDDGDTSLLTDLASQFGPATIGIVLAHEYGHAIQQRTGALRQNLPTVVTEQQADCIAGAWAGRAAAGQASGVPFNDNDIRAGLIAMIRVQDPVGADPTAPGAHGSGFDRVGAFQEGFNGGLARCAPLVDEPLPLTPLQFLPGSLDFVNQGNAPYGYDADPNNPQLFSFLIPDLNAYWDEQLDAQFPNFNPITVVPVQSAAEIVCDQPRGYATFGMELCAETSTVFVIDPIMRSVYDTQGDFGPGYLLGIVWAEAAQISNQSPAAGEGRQLRNDCLVGSWVDTLIPDPTTGQLPAPRPESRTASVSPGDLTEAVLTAIAIGDRTADSDVLGSAFEKVDAFRIGALTGLGACG